MVFVTVACNDQLIGGMRPKCNEYKAHVYKVQGIRLRAHGIG